MLELKNVTKTYGSKDNAVHALKGVSIAFRPCEFVSILGPSGCGKTTLLNIIGGLDRYSDGDLCVDGKSTKEYKDRDWDTYRNHSIERIHTAKVERDKIVAERDSEADYSQALEQAKNGEIAHSKSGLKAQVVALTVENKNLSEENERLKKDNSFLFESYQKEKKTHNDHDKALRAITLFREQEPEAFARVFYRAASVLQPFLPIDEQPAPLGRNRLREIEEEIRKEQEQNTPTPRKNNYGKAD